VATLLENLESQGKSRNLEVESEKLEKHGKVRENVFLSVVCYYCTYCGGHEITADST